MHTLQNNLLIICNPFYRFAPWIFTDNDKTRAAVVEDSTKSFTEIAESYSELGKISCQAYPSFATSGSVAENDYMEPEDRAAYFG